MDAVRRERPLEAHHTRLGVDEPGGVPVAPEPQRRVQQMVRVLARRKVLLVEHEVPDARGVVHRWRSVNGNRALRLKFTRQTPTRGGVGGGRPTASHHVTRPVEGTHLRLISHAVVQAKACHPTFSERRLSASEGCVRGAWRWGQRRWSQTLRVTRHGRGDLKQHLKRMLHGDRKPVLPHGAPHFLCNVGDDATCRAPTAKRDQFVALANPGRDAEFRSGERIGRVEDGCEELVEACLTLEAEGAWRLARGRRGHPQFD